MKKNYLWSLLFVANVVLGAAIGDVGGELAEVAKKSEAEAKKLEAQAAKVSPIPDADYIARAREQVLEKIEGQTSENKAKIDETYKKYEDEIPESEKEKKKQDLETDYLRAVADVETSMMEIISNNKRIEANDVKIRSYQAEEKKPDNPGEQKNNIDQLEESNRVLTRRNAQIEKSIIDQKYKSDKLEKILEDNGWKNKGEKLPGQEDMELKAQHEASGKQARELQKEYEESSNLRKEYLRKKIKEAKALKTPAGNELAKRYEEEIKSIDTIKSIFDLWNNKEKFEAEKAGLRAQIARSKDPKFIAKAMKKIKEISEQVAAIEKSVKDHVGNIQGTLSNINAILDTTGRIGKTIVTLKKEILETLVALGIIGSVTVAGVEIVKADGSKDTYKGDKNNVLLLQAITKADIGKVHSLLTQANPVDPNFSMTGGTTPLMLAVNLSTQDPNQLSSYSTIINMLLSYGANVNAADYKNGMTALMDATTNNNVPIVSLLLQEGFKITPRIDVNEQNSNGDTALILAVQNENVETVNKLLQKNVLKRLNFDVQNNQGDTALSLAQRLGNQAIIDAIQQAKNMAESLNASQQPSNIPSDISTQPIMGSTPSSANVGMPAVP